MTWTTKRAAAGIALVFVLIASQGLAAATAPAVPATDTVGLLSDTGFAYLAGVRTFAAAVLWNQLDPILHAYYEGAQLKDQVYTLPSMKMITLLDPEFIQAYYVASYIVTDRGDIEAGLQIARDGVAKNPHSGLLRANLAQLLLLDDPKGNLPEMLSQTRAGLQPTAQWRDADDLYDAIVTFRAVYDLAGNQEQAAMLTARLRQLKDSGQLSAEDHDHDRDGKQDH